jgi:hypothetical protein
VIWYKDLIPSTDNVQPYEYDSQGDPVKVEHPITREEIIQVVMDVSEQDCLGTLSNIHLAFADKEGIDSEICLKLAGDISQEVDAAKTGKHPLNEEEISELRKKLGDELPDFMRRNPEQKTYPSPRILGKRTASGNARKDVRFVQGNYIVQHNVVSLVGETNKRA